MAFLLFLSLLGSQPPFSSHFPFLRGRPFNRGSTVFILNINFKKNLAEKSCFDSRLRSEALLKFESYSRYTDNHFISELVANGNIIGNSQTVKQMKDLHLKYEIIL